jgi:hypothetical protein
VSTIPPPPDPFLGPWANANDHAILHGHNVALMRQVADYIEQEEDRFDMSSWFYGGARYSNDIEGYEMHACGSAACIAGSAVHVAGMTRQLGVVRNPHWAEVGAAQALGLTYGEALQLFIPGSYFWMAYMSDEDRALGSITAHVAAKVLRELADGKLNLMEYVP